MNDLLSKKCVPCEGGELPLTQKQAELLLPQVPDWALRGEKEIRREFTFKDFAEALRFVNAVAALAEGEGHHPDILIHGWNHVSLTLSTHAIKGLSGNDFIIAAKINEIAKKFGVS